ncbi:MAG: acetate--CoA ligase alpha subunit [Bacteroidota bacterium]
MRAKLDKLLQPNTIAIIGASNREGSVGNSVMKNMLNAGYAGVIYPINIKEKSVSGVQAYPEIQQTPQKVDLAVICTPAETVPKIVEQCGEAGVGGIIIISTGFLEAGEEGIELHEQVAEIARKYKIRILGPNCLGIINPRLGINASFAPGMALPGRLALISQSGALLSSILDWSIAQRVGFSHFISVGSMMDVDLGDLIDYFGKDQYTSCILIYLESLKNARHFMSAARAISRFKPIVVLKAGRSEEGSKAALSHTGAMAGDDKVYEAVLQRAGVIRVDTVAQLFNMAQAVAMQARPTGNRLAIITNAGGPGVLATDYLSSNGGHLADLSEDTLKALTELVPKAWSHGNPIDLLGDADAHKYQEAVKLCVKDPGIDGVLVILTPQTNTDPEAIAAAVAEAAKKSRKPILASWMGENAVLNGREVLEAGRVPNYRYPESAVDVFLRLYKYSIDLELLYETPSSTPVGFQPNREVAEYVIKQAKEQGRRTLQETEAKNLLNSYGIEVSRNKICKTKTEALKFAKLIGYPVVLKIASPDIIHKTEAGGVKLNIRTPSELKETFDLIKDNALRFKPGADIEGVCVERMVEKGYQLILGGIKDPTFGPVVAFGAGGVAVEILNDIRMGLPPLNMALAARMVQNTKIYQLLKGFRGLPGVDMEALHFLLCKFAYLFMDFPEIKEIDVNPYVVDAKGGLALDARVVLATGDEIEKRQHLVIAPYPFEYEKEITLKKGNPALLRPVRPEDEPGMFKFLEGVSSESMYMRFFGFVPQFTHNLMTRFVNIDYDREVAIVAEVEGEIIGIVRIIEDPWRDTAEYSILISDNWHGQGLGNTLTDYILDLARDRKIKKIVATVLASNAAMIHIFQRRGFQFVNREIDTYEVELDLTKIEAQASAS